MIADLILGSLVAASVGLDAALTLRRLKISPKLEANPLVRKLAEKYGAKYAVLYAVALPQAAIASALGAFYHPGFFMFAGASLYRAIMQLLSLGLEHQLAMHVDRGSSAEVAN